MTENGLIILSTTHLDEDNAVVISVKDNGCGISETALEHIFDPFYTTKKVGEGTGLGLYISYSIIEAMGGQLAVTSQINVGTEFTITLPVAE